MMVFFLPRRLKASMLFFALLLTMNSSGAYAFGGPMPNMIIGEDPFGYCLTDTIEVVINYAGHCRPKKSRIGGGSGSSGGGSTRSASVRVSGSSGGGSGGGSGRYGNTGSHTASDLTSRFGPLNFGSGRGSGGSSNSSGGRSGGFAGVSIPSFGGRSSGSRNGSAGGGSTDDSSSLFPERGDKQSALEGYLSSLRDRFSGEDNEGSSGGSNGNGEDGSPFSNYLVGLHDVFPGGGSSGAGEDAGGGGNDGADGSDTSPHSGYVQSLLAGRLNDKEERAKNRDSDGDGVSDYDERRLGLDPYNRDSDRDGVPDGIEVGNPRSPRKSPKAKVIDALNPRNDSDRDGISNADEVVLGTDPQDKDTDGDGVHDGTEVGDPSNPFITERAYYIDALNPFNDSDGDGYANLDEVRDGTDPLDPFDPAFGSKEERENNASVRTISSERARKERETLLRSGGLPKTGAERGEWFRPKNLSLSLSIAWRGNVCVFGISKNLGGAISMQK